MTNSLHLKKRGFDVAVFVATTGEMDAIIKNTIDINRSQWVTEHDNNGEIIRTLLVKDHEGRVLRLALQALPIMGAEACIYYVSRFLSEHPCTFVSMVGICAGERNNTKKGDLVIPGIVASITNGKEREHEDKSRDFRPANRPHKIGESLRRKLASFKAVHWNTVKKEMMGKWNTANPAWQEEEDYREPELLFEEKLMMAQVMHVRAYSDSFEDLERFASREVVALEMESAALAYVVEKMRSSDGRWLVIKGVQDYADGVKDHKFRPFCSWSSFFTLIKFLELEGLDCWANKVRIKKDIEKIKAKETANELKEAYRSGEFYKAFSIGNGIFNARPNDSSIWRTYLLSLMRMQEYEKAADMIGIADYYIQMKEVRGKDALDYLVGKSDYYLRIGSLKDSTTYIDEIISQCKGKSELKEQTAQAHYMKGRIFLSRHQQYHEATLDDAIDQFAAAVNLSPGKYWASILLLFAKYLKTRKDPFEIGQVEQLEMVLAAHIKENEWRPAPRIYRLKLHALRVAVGKITFKQFQNVINEEVKHCRQRLLLPNDFFLDFENDCRLLFADDKDRHKQDKLLSLVYRWASKVRRRT